MKTTFAYLNKIRVIDNKREELGFGIKVEKLTIALNFQKEFFKQAVRKNLCMKSVDTKRKELGLGSKVVELEVADSELNQLFILAASQKRIQIKQEKLEKAKARVFKRGTPSPYKEPRIPRTIAFPVKVKVEQPEENQYDV